MNKNTAYDPSEIEPKWQDNWEDKNIFEVDEKSNKDKFYVLTEFPYPSGDGLHAGHLRPNTAMDIIARKHRMQGKNVLFPMGYDAFGLPTENFAIKKNIAPQIVTEKNITNFERQFKSLGFSFDWSRSFSTTDEDYYRWTQWIFIQMYNKGLAYKAKENINWCNDCKIGLANEEVVNGTCERCDGEVVKKEKEQWMLKITEYADRLIDDLDNVDFLEKIKTQQKNWIGRSEGVEVDFAIKDTSHRLKVFTTRPDTLFGVTFMVISPEHEIIHKLEDKIENLEEVKIYIAEAAKKTDIERASDDKEKTGIDIKGIKAINPANDKEIPIFVADYVLTGYGTGAIMAVPAHDQRDWEFAKKYDLDITRVVKPKNKKKVFIFHGTGGHSTKNWYPWLKNLLEDDGFEFIIPNFPNANKPISEDWLEAIKKYRDILDEGSIIIGHSLGCPTAWQFLQYANKKISQMILVAPVHPDMDYQKILNTHDEEVTSYIKTFTKKPVSWNKVRDLVDKKTIFLSEDDPYIPFDVKELFKRDLNPIFKLYKDKKHFNKNTADMVDFPDILKNIDREAYSGEGESMNSGKYNGLDTEIFKKKITTWLEKNKFGKKTKNYRLRDWIFSRQRYWGEPIPMIHCEKCDWVPVPENELPVTLPKTDNFQPGDDGESPLKKIKEWVNTTCPKCGGEAKRETDVMPNWAGSNWYFIRFADPKNNREIVSADKAKYWLPVDWYQGGMEHTTLHLLYSRFIYKFLYDIKAIPQECGNEPYKKRTAHGMILGEGGIKMSKSKGNVVSPDDYVGKYGADAMRTYIMFMGPFDQDVAWNDQGVAGIYRFLNKVWELQNKISEIKIDKKTDNISHKTIKKVSDDIDNMRFNTAISQLMIMTNELDKQNEVSKDIFKKFILLLAPFAPHMCEELWQNLGHVDSIAYAQWPDYDEDLAKDEAVTIGIQVNGKVRDDIELAIDTEPSEKLQTEILSRDKIRKNTEGKQVVKFIHIKNKIISIVVK